MTGDEPASFGDLLRRTRRAAGITQEQLADRAGLSVRGISDLERGARKTPRHDTLELLAEAFDLSEAERDQWSRLRRELARRESGAHSRERPSSQPIGNLSVPLTALIGREEMVSELSSWIESGDRRLVTVSGPGGVGKTRLAIAVGHRLLESMPDGVWFVDLAPLTRAESVIPAIASTLGITTADMPVPLDAVLEALRLSKRLIVLDNFEHVVDAAPDIANVLSRCPQVSILVTSRTSLLIQGEREYHVPPLPLPATAAGTSIQDLGDNPSIALFTERAQAVWPDFHISDDNKAAVAEICHRLDGLPLALELAAARIRLLPPKAMLERLEPRLPFLVGANRDAPARQQTLHATIQWSYDLLDPDDQHLLRMLSVFRGGWTLEAAEAVADPAMDVLTGLQTLIHHSLVRVREEPDGTARYTILETVREFGYEQLVESNERDPAHRRHAAYFANVVEESSAFLSGPGQRNAYERLLREHPNTQAALRWSIEHNDANTAVRLCVGLDEFWLWHGQRSEGRYWFEKALSLAGGVRPELRARMYRSLAGLVGEAGEVDVSEKYLDEAIALYREVGDMNGLASTIRDLGGLQFYRGNFDRAATLVEESLAIARSTGNKDAIATALGSLSAAAAIDGDFSKAEALANESLQLFRELEDELGVARILGYQGFYALWQGDLERARRIALESLRLVRDLGVVYTGSYTLELLGYIDLERGAFHQASESFFEGLVGFYYDLRAMMCTAECLEGLAGVAAGLGHPLRAAVLLGSATALRQRIHSPVQPTRRTQYERIVASARSGLHPEEFENAYCQGQSMPLADAVSLALEPLQ